MKQLIEQWLRECKDNQHRRNDLYFVISNTGFKNSRIAREREKVISDLASDLAALLENKSIH